MRSIKALQLYQITQQKDGFTYHINDMVIIIYINSRNPLLISVWIIFLSLLVINHYVIRSRNICMIVHFWSYSQHYIALQYMREPDHVHFIHIFSVFHVLHLYYLVIFFVVILYYTYMWNRFRYFIIILIYMCVQFYINFIIFEFCLFRTFCSYIVEKCMLTVFFFIQKNYIWN